MDDYIERKAAIELLHYYADETCSAVVSDFEAIPAADIDRPTASQFKRMAAQMDYAPVVHGKWIPAVIDGTWSVCSKCSDNGRAISCKLFRQRYKYCPHCGAKMDGEDGKR